MDTMALYQVLARRTEADLRMMQQVRACVRLQKLYAGCAGGLAIGTALLWFVVVVCDTAWWSLEMSAAITVMVAVLGLATNLRRRHLVYQFSAHRTERWSLAHLALRPACDLNERGTWCRT